MSDAKKRILTIQITNNVVWNKDISNAKRHLDMLISNKDYNHKTKDFVLNIQIALFLYNAAMFRTCPKCNDLKWQNTSFPIWLSKI